MQFHQSAGSLKYNYKMTLSTLIQLDTIPDTCAESLNEMMYTDSP